MSKRIKNNVVSSHTYSRVINGKDYRYCQLTYYVDNEKHVETYTLNGVENEGVYINKLVEEKTYELTKHNFKVWFNKFLDYKRVDVDFVTYNSYLTRSKHILDIFGDKYIEDISSQDIFNFYVYLLKHGKVSQLDPTITSGLSYTTVHDNCVLLRMFYRYLIDMCMLDIKDVCGGIKVPHLENNVYKAEEPYMTKEQVFEFMNYVHNHDTYKKYELAFWMLFIYGLRRSELLGLRWRSINIERNELYIEHTLVRSGVYKVQKDSTKNKYSERKYPIVDKIKEQLLFEYNNRDDSSEYMFGWLDPDTLSKTFKKIISYLNYNDRLHLHSTRHSCVCILAENGMSWNDIKNWIGHSKKSDTLERTYLHVVGELRKQSADNVSAIFS